MIHNVFKDQTIDGDTTTATAANVIPIDLSRNWHPHGEITLCCKVDSGESDLRDIDILYRLKGDNSGWGGWVTFVDDYSAATDDVGDGVSCNDNNMHPLDVSIPWVGMIEWKINRGSGGDADCTVNIDMYIN